MGVVRLRSLTPAQELRLKALRHMSELLDSAFVVPGTNYRFGLDPIIGLVPVIGDLASPLFTIAVLWQGRDLGIPKVVQLRMIFNAAIDALIGAIPIAGDLFDFAWKSNQMNLALLERHAYEEHPGERRRLALRRRDDPAGRGDCRRAVCRRCLAFRQRRQDVSLRWRREGRAVCFCCRPPIAAAFARG